MTARPKAAGADAPPRRGPAAKGGRRTAARVAAVQALYQIEMAGAEAGPVIAEFRDHRLGAGAKGAPDPELFAAVVAGAWARRDEIDALLRPALAEGWAWERLDAVMRALLRAALAELLAGPDVPARVVLNEYVRVAHAFFVARDAGFANGILDRLARRLRPAEVAPGSGGAADDGGQAER